MDSICKVSFMVPLDHLGVVVETNAPLVVGRPLPFSGSADSKMEH